MMARIPLLALAGIFSLGAAAQQPAPASATASPQAVPAAAAQKNAAATAQEGQPQPPQGNLTIQVMRDDGTPVPDADIAIDGMRAGMGPMVPGQSNGAGASNAQSPGALTGSSESNGAQPASAQPPALRCISAQAASIEAGGTQPGSATATPSQAGNSQPGGGVSSSGQTGSGRSGNAQAGNGNPGGAQSNGGQAGHAQSGSNKSGSAQPGAPPSRQNCYSANTVLPGTAESISDLGLGASADAATSAPSLPPGVVPLRTDAQGQLTLQLSDGPHTLSVSVYGFDPFTGQFTLGGKHRQIVQIKLSTAPTSYILAVGPDNGIQLETPQLDALIPLEPLQTLVPLPARTRGHVL